MVRHCDCGNKLGKRNDSGVCIECYRARGTGTSCDEGSGYRWGHMNAEVTGRMYCLKPTPISEIPYLGGGMGKYE